MKYVLLVLTTLILLLSLSTFCTNQKSSTDSLVTVTTGVESSSAVSDTTVTSTEFSILSTTGTFETSATRPTTTRTTAQPLVDVQKKKLSVLIIGNSHSIDAFWLLYQAYKDQYPDADLCVGILHYNGASVDRHIGFLEKGDAVIRYYKNDSGWWRIKYDVTSKAVLTDQPWDIIMMQPAKVDLSDPNLNRDGRYRLAKLVDQYVTNPHEFVWHVSWPSPNDETFFSPDYIRQPPSDYKDNLIKLYGFNPITQFGLQTEMTRKWVLDDPLYSNAICSGTSVMHATLTQGVPQLELWRDYTHLSDYGRLMVGYAITAQLTGNPIRQVGIDEIPVGWRHRQTAPQGVQIITPTMKRILVDACNYALKNPWNVPPQHFPLPTTTTITTTTETTTATTTTKKTTAATTKTTTTTKETAVTTTEATTDSTVESTTTTTEPVTTETEPTTTTTVVTEPTTTETETSEPTEPAA